VAQLKIPIPTYDPNGTPEYDWSRPHELIVRGEDGLRVCMGNEADAPDVLIERAVDCWRIFVHPDRGDPLCIIEFTDTTAVVKTDRVGAEPLLTQQRGE